MQNFDEYEITPRPEETLPQEPWFKKSWRPAAAWIYLGICVFDFVLGPCFMGFLAIWSKTAYVAWTPLTLQGGGLFHLAYGAIIGSYVYGRTREKLFGAQFGSEIRVREFERRDLGLGRDRYYDSPREEPYISRRGRDV